MSATAAMLAGEEDDALAPCVCGPLGKCARSCSNRPRARAKRAKSRRLESGLQRAIIARVKLHGVVCVHIKNEAVRSMLGHIDAKRDGVLPGFPDLIAMQAPMLVAFPEVKEPGWKPPGPGAKGQAAHHYRRQCDAHAMLRRLGFVAGFVTSQEEAIALLKEAGFRIP